MTQEPVATRRRWSRETERTDALASALARGVDWSRLAVEAELLPPFMAYAAMDRVTRFVFAVRLRP